MIELNDVRTERSSSNPKDMARVWPCFCAADHVLVRWIPERASAKSTVWTAVFGGRASDGRHIRFPLLRSGDSSCP